jgi:hypothetical protein
VGARLVAVGADRAVDELVLFEILGSDQTHNRQYGKTEDSVLDHVSMVINKT